MNAVKFSLLVASILAVFASASYADTSHQVFYRYGLNFMNNPRSGEVFTDTLGTSGINNKTGGWNIGAGLDLGMHKNLGPGDLLGEVLLNYSQYSREEVLQTTSFLVNHAIPAIPLKTSKVAVSEFMAMIGPKYRFHGLLDNRIKPWVIPAGLAFLVNSPPSNDTTYLDVGYHAGVGIDVQIIELLSIGVDYRYTFAFGEPNYNASGSTADLYLGINF